jgi:hypothetical protein
LACEPADIDAGRLGDGTVVGERPAGRAAMGIEDSLETKPLGCLGLPEAVARHGFQHAAVGTAFQCVGNRYAGQGAIGPVQGVENAVDHVTGHKGPGGIVDQHVVRRFFCQGLQTGGHRSLAGRPAGDRFADLESGDRPVVEIA